MYIYIYVCVCIYTHTPKTYSVNLVNTLKRILSKGF